jgi:hypothetical protein
LQKGAKKWQFLNIKHRSLYAYIALGKYIMSVFAQNVGENFDLALVQGMQRSVTKTILSRVARWFIFKPKIPIWV